jgi:hypothetical protein
VVLFPLYTLVKAGWGWFNSSRIVSWYPRIHAIERNLETSSLTELMAQQDFLRSLDARLARQKRVPASYMAVYYDLRTDLTFVIHKVEARITKLGGEAALTAAQANDALLPRDPHAITDAAMGIDHRPPVDRRG